MRPRARQTVGDDVRERIRARFANPFSRLDGYPPDLPPEEAEAFRELYPEDCPRPEPTPAERAVQHQSTLRAYAIGQARGVVGPSSYAPLQAEIEAWAGAHPEEIRAAVEEYHQRTAAAPGNVRPMPQKR